MTSNSVKAAPSSARAGRVLSRMGHGTMRAMCAPWPLHRVRVLRRFMCGSAAGHVLVSSLRVRQISFDLVDNDGSSDQGGKVRSFVLAAGPGGSCFVFGTVIFW
jgi:hypothetical protein